MYAPFVLTDDLPHLFNQISPLQTAVQKDALKNASTMIANAAKLAFNDIQVISAESMELFLRLKTQEDDTPIISLTSLLPANRTNIFSVEGSRSVEEKKDDFGAYYSSIGIQPRSSSTPILTEQFKLVADNIRTPGKIVDIADDVVFSGGTVIDCIKSLLQHGITTRRVIATVALTTAQERINELGVSVTALREYNRVKDEVCMRDLIIGAPDGGRNIRKEDGTYAAVPYVSPFGALQEWASVPKECVRDFSHACLQASLEVWSAYGPSTRFSALRKPVHNCPPDAIITQHIGRLLESRAYEQPRRAL